MREITGSGSPQPPVFGVGLGLGVGVGVGLGDGLGVGVGVGVGEGVGVATGIVGMGTFSIEDAGALLGCVGSSSVIVWQPTKKVAAAAVAMAIILMRRPLA